MTHPFERTACSCRDCVACCKRKPGPLVPSDLDAMREAGLNVEDALVRSPGGVYGRMTPDGLKLTRVPTITPRRVNGRCVFLFNERCMIHDIAPFGCAYFDTHMDRNEAHARSIYMAGLQQDPAYQAFRKTLKEEK